MAVYEIIVYTYITKVCPYYLYFIGAGAIFLLDTVSTALFSQAVSPRIEATRSTSQPEQASSHSNNNKSTSEPEKTSNQRSSVKKSTSQSGQSSHQDNDENDENNSEEESEDSFSQQSEEDEESDTQEKRKKTLRRRKGKSYNRLPVYRANKNSKKIQNVQRTTTYRNGYITELGFNYGPHPLSISYKFYCNGDGTRIHYTHNTINGSVINNCGTHRCPSSFVSNGMNRRAVDFSRTYNRVNQIACFESLLGSAQPYINSRQFLARGHLTPDADMIWPFEKKATYTYANVAPQFQSINAGNWLRVEKLARSLAAQLNRNLRVYTGTMGILRLPHTLSPTNEVAIYLDDNIPVPEYFFKVVLDEESDSAIVFVTSNNPFATQETEFSRNIANETGFDNPHFQDCTRGYTFCMSLSEFKRYYPHLPEDVNASNVLNKNSPNNNTNDKKPEKKY